MGSSQRFEILEEGGDGKSNVGTDHDGSIHETTDHFSVLGLLSRCESIG